MPSHRLGNEKYKSKTSPRAKWLEQFDLHLFEEDQLLEVVVCSRNVNIGKCLIDLKSLPRETTHRLWNKFEDCIGEIYLLLTISGTTSSETISDLTTYREDKVEIQSLEKKYVSSFIATKHTSKLDNHREARNKIERFFLLFRKHVQLEV